MSAPEYVNVMRDGVLTVYEVRGVDAVPVLTAQLRPMSDLEVASFVRNVQPYLMAPRVAKSRAPRRSGLGAIIAAAGTDAPRHARIPRAEAATRAAQVRAAVEAEPGITRRDLLVQLGINQPSGTQWQVVLEQAGVYKTKHGSGRGAMVRYWPDAASAAAGTNGSAAT